MALEDYVIMNACKAVHEYYEVFKCYKVTEEINSFEINNDKLVPANQSLSIWFAIKFKYNMILLHK